MRVTRTCAPSSWTTTSRRCACTRACTMESSRRWRRSRPRTVAGVLVHEQGRLASPRPAAACVGPWSGRAACVVSGDNGRAAQARTRAAESWRAPWPSGRCEGGGASLLRGPTNLRDVQAGRACGAWETVVAAYGYFRQHRRRQQLERGSCDRSPAGFACSGSCRRNDVASGNPTARPPSWPSLEQMAPALSEIALSARDLGRRP